MKTWVFAGCYNAETTAWSEFATSGMASPYTPGINGQLKAVRLVAGREAATTLMDHVQVRLTNNSWQPNIIECGITGSGLQTAPALMSGDVARADFEVDQPISANGKITLEGRCIGDTHVTVRVFVYLMIEVGGR